MPSLRPCMLALVFASCSPAKNVRRVKHVSVPSATRGAQCPVRPTDASKSLPEYLASRPLEIGRHRLSPGQALALGDLRIEFVEEFLPMRSGGRQGRWVPSMKGAITNGAPGSPQRVSSWIESPRPTVIELPPYRWQLDYYDKDKPSVSVQRLACSHDEERVALEPGEGRRVWLSTRGIRNLSVDSGRAVGPKAQPGAEEIGSLTLSRGQDDGLPRSYYASLYVWTPDGVCDAWQPASPAPASCQAGGLTVTVTKVVLDDGVEVRGARMSSEDTFLDLHLLVEIKRQAPS